MAETAPVPLAPTMPLPALLFAFSLAAAPENDSWLGADKAAHFGASAALSAGGYAAASLFTDDVRWRLGAGAGLSLAAGIGKELWDLSGRGTPSWKDFAWDCLGNATGLLVAWTLDRFVFTEDPPRRAARPRPSRPAPCAACSPLGVPPLRAPTLAGP